MNSKTKKTIKNVGMLLLLVLIALAVGYVAYSYFQFSGSDIELADLCEKTYISYDENYVLDFAENGITFLRKTEKTEYSEVSYAEGVITAKTDTETLQLYVLDGGRTLYNDALRVYLHERVDL